MYLLTKKIRSENNLNQDAFDFLIKSNYSKESLCDFVCEIDENSEVFKEIEKALLIQIGMAD